MLLALADIQIRATDQCKMSAAVAAKITEPMLTRTTIAEVRPAISQQ
jgi:hypothetical protein